MRTRRLLVVLAASVSVVTAMAACSSGGSSSAGGSTTVSADALKAGPSTGWPDAGMKVDPASLKCGLTSSQPTRGITDSSITVGGLGYLTSPTGSTIAGTEQGAKARFERANAEGGVNGRKINYIGTLDTGDDSARTAAQAKVLAQQKKVFAVVPLLTRDASYLDTFCNDKVPFFGWGSTSGFCNNTLGFGITGCLVGGGSGYTSSAYGLLIQAMLGGSAKGKSAALVGVDNDSARTGLQELASQVRAVGIRTVYTKNPFPATGVTDTTAVVNDLMTADKGHAPDVILHALDFNSVVKLTSALNSAGYKGKQLNPVGYDPRLAGFKDLQQSYTVLQWEPGTDTSVPAVKQLADDFHKYAPDTSISLPAMSGYWAADMFITALQKVGRDLTVDKLLKVLNTNYSYSVPGALPETRWPINHNISAPCGSVVQLNGKNFDITAKLFCGGLLKK